MKASILKVLRKSTDLVLKFDSHEIVLIPHQRVRVPGGAFDSVPQAPRPPQIFQVEVIGATLSGMAGATGGIMDSSGMRGHSWAYKLRGRYDAQIEIDDVWQNGETEYKVISIEPYNDYEKTAVVEAIGKDPSYGS